MPILIPFSIQRLWYRGYPLALSTPDGSGQAVHPDIALVPNGFLGFRYWMACTPYPFGDDRVENPIIRVSHNGIDWRCFPGSPDPIVPTPEDSDWHHADTDLVIHDEQLHLFYIATNRKTGETIFWTTVSRNAVDWTSPVEVYSGQWGVSPAVCVCKDGSWRMWYVWCDTIRDQQQSLVYRRDGSSSQSFSEPQDCSIEIPGHVVWHLDVLEVEDGYETLVTAFPRGTNPSRSRLFHASSTDGICFRLTSNQPIIRPSWSGWDNRMIYRSSFIRNPDRSYRIWYTGASWGMRCGIGVVEGATLSDLNYMPVGPASSGPKSKIAEDLLGFMKYVLIRFLHTRAINLLKSIRFRMTVGYRRDA